MCKRDRETEDGVGEAVGRARTAAVMRSCRRAAAGFAVFDPRVRVGGIRVLGARCSPSDRPNERTMNATAPARPAEPHRHRNADGESRDGVRKGDRDTAP